MSLSSLTAKTDYDMGRRAFPRARQSQLERRGDADESEAPAIPEPSRDFDSALDAAAFASRFRANLSQLAVLSPPATEAPPLEPGVDDALFDFFGNLSVMLVSVRNGDIDRARAAADAMGLELMIEGGLDAGRVHLLEDLRHMLSAAQSGDERAARAAAKDVARDVRDALEPPRAPPHAADADMIDATAAAYDTLMAYSEGEAPQAA